MVCTKAMQLLLFKWLLTALFVTLSYKQVLLANLVETGYEKPIETLDELVNSGKPFIVPQNTNFPRMLAMDPRPSIKKLDKQILWYNFTANEVAKWARDG